jgi:hypothetical protein
MFSKIIKLNDYLKIFMLKQELIRIKITFHSSFIKKNEKLFRQVYIKIL